MLLKRILISSVFLSGITYAQTTLRVPLTNSGQCEGPNCANSSTTQENGAVLPDDGDSGQSSRIDRSADQSERGRSSDRGVRLGRADKQSVPTYGIPRHSSAH